MNHSFQAVTVSHYYLEPDEYATKYLRVTKRHDGTPIWWVIQQDRRYKLFSTAERRAKFISAKHGIPYVEDVRHGERVTKTQIDLLEKYGFVLSALIQRKENAK